MSSYQAIITKLTNKKEIENANTISIGYVLGEQLIVPKDMPIGMVGVFFQPEIQLSEEFCHNNNLFIKTELNKDTTKRGYFDKNRRVRCQNFMKVKSSGLFLPLDSLLFTGIKLEELKEGLSFNELNGTHICKRYISEKTLNAMANAGTTKVKINEFPTFQKHISTDQFKYSVGKIEKGSLLSFHHKVHGTSQRYGYLPKEIQLNKFQKFVNRFIPLFKEREYDYVVGTRNVILKSATSDTSFYGDEAFRFKYLEIVKPILKKGMTIYGEIAGFNGSTPIMGKHSTKVLNAKEYTKKYGDEMTYAYGCTPNSLNENRFHIYRITIQNEDGSEIIDYTPKQIEELCMRHDLLCHLNVHEPIIYDGDKEKLMELVERLTECDNLTEDIIDRTHVSEGIIIREDNGNKTPNFYKNKSFAFKVMEGIYNENNVDTETSDNFLE